MNSRRRNKRKTKRNGEVQRSPAVSNETLDDQGSKRSLLGWGFLPCLTHEGRRWWLPSDPSTSLLLAELAITICGKELQHSNSNLRRQVRNVLQEKSSLFLYCVFHLAKEKQHESTYSLDDVAEWLRGESTGPHFQGRRISGCTKNHPRTLPNVVPNGILFSHAASKTVD